MTREEEIKLVAECAVTDEKYAEFKEGLIWGAKWADTNPKKGMINIDKACEWLEHHVNDDKYYSCIGEEILIPYLIEDFKKAMEK